MPFQRLEAVADIAFVPVEGADKFRMATRDPAVRPLVVSSQPA
jgi:hypothetical protein